MKTIVVALFVFISFSASAQIDSTRAFVSVGVQFRDMKYLMGTGILNPTDPSLKTMYDSVEAKIRRNPNLTETTNITVPAIQTRGLITISSQLRTRAAQPGLAVYDRIHTAIKNASGNVGRPYLLRIIADMDATNTLQYNAIIQEGTRRALAVDN